MKKIYALAIGLLLLTGCATAQNIQLPEPNMDVEAKFMDVLQQRASSREFSNKAISNDVLSQLLWASCGINREDGHLTVPSAINAQDIKLYVIRKDGAFLYIPQENQLKKITNKDLRKAVASKQSFAEKAPVSLVMVSDLTKFGNRKDRAEKMATFDAAYVSENICLACTAFGLVTVPRMTMDVETLILELGLADTDLPLLNNPIGWREKK